MIFVFNDKQLLTLGIVVKDHIYWYIFAVGDGRMGFTEEAPFDAIHVGAAAPNVPQAVRLNAHILFSALPLFIHPHVVQYMYMLQI